MNLPPHFFVKHLIFALIIIFISVRLVPYGTGADAFAMSMRSSFNVYNETTAQNFTLEDVNTFVQSWKLLFAGFSIIVALLCYTVAQKFKNLASRKHVVLIICTPLVITIKAMTKLYYEDMSYMQDTILEYVIEIFGAVSLLSFWVLFQEFNQARAEPIPIDQRLLYWAYQYVGIRLSSSVFMVVLQLFGTFSFWLKVFVYGILFVSEVVAIGCITRLGVLVATRPYIIMFFFYKSFKYTIWLQESIVLLLGYFNYIDLSNGIRNLLYAAIILEMIAVGIFQHKYYQLRGERSSD